ncbi:MAG: ABC transporter permease [Betaproteobacteria bacterium]|nr:ABC transporter permease [Betaproteobacteria bacterium]
MPSSEPISAHGGQSSAVARQRHPRSFFQRNAAWLLGGGALIGVLAIWECLWLADAISPLFFSGPSAVAKRFVVEFNRGTLMSDVAYSGRNFLVGFGLACLVAIPLGVVLGWYRYFRLLVDPMLSAFYATPRIAFIPLIIIWFGIGMWSKVFIIFLASLFPILINTIAGVKNIDPDLLKASRAFCATDRQIFITVALPYSVPFILAGVRQGVAHGLIGVIVGELFAGSEGVGFMIAFAGQTFATDLLLVGVTITATAGILISMLADRVQQHFSKWRTNETGQ